MLENRFELQNTNYTQYKGPKNGVQVDYYAKLYEKLSGGVHFSIKNQESYVNKIINFT